MLNPILHPVILETEVALLRPIDMADVEHFRPFSEGEPDVWTYSLRGAGGADLVPYVSEAIAAREAGKEYAFSVYDKRTGQYAGSTRYYDIQPKHGSLLLGYTWYGKAFQQTGLNTHCKYLMLGYAIEVLRAQRVELRADHRNIHSRSSMAKLGLLEEGILRSHLPTADGGRRDTVVLSVLPDEWYSKVKPLLEAKMKR